MAVKAAVVGYEELTKPFEEVSDGNEEETKVDVEKVEEEEEIEDRELDELEKKDLEGLLMADVDGEVDEPGDEEDDVGLRGYSFHWFRLELTCQYTELRSISRTRCMSSMRTYVISPWTGSFV